MVARDSIDLGKFVLDSAQKSYDFVDKIWKKLNIGEPIATTVTYLYPKSQMRTTRIYKVPLHRRNLFKTRITLPAGSNFQIVNLFDLDTGVDYAKISVHREEGRVILDSTKLPSSCERLMITTLNNVDRTFLRNLVDVRVSELASREEIDKEKHWIVAAIRDESLLRPFYNQATLEDVDVGVGINVDRNYSTLLRKDNPLMRLMRANQNIFRGIDRNQRSLENVGKTQRRRILKKETKRTKEGIFPALARLCIPEIFRNYIDIENPNFSYINSSRSENLMTLGNIIIPIPSRMTVKIFTTLKFDEPAQQGHLIFNRDDFCNDVEKVIKEHFNLK